MNHLWFVVSSSHPSQVNNETNDLNEDVVNESDEDISEHISNEFWFGSFFLTHLSDCIFLLTWLDKWLVPIKIWMWLGLNYLIQIRFFFILLLLWYLTLITMF